MLTKTYSETPVRTLRGFIPSEELYGQIQNSFIIDCVDFVSVDPLARKLHLAKRLVHSAKGVWRFGGRRKAGETMPEALVRLSERELGLTLAPDRFEYVIDQDCIWSWREQAPQEEGSHCLIHVFKTSLTQAELVYAGKHLDPKEYDVSFGIRSYDRAQLLREYVRPQLVDLYDAIFDPVKI